MNPNDLIRQLAEVADDVGTVVVPPDVASPLQHVCTAARLSLGAAATSIARVDGDSLVFLASDGPGADRIIGTRLPLGRGIAGLVALTGQSLAIERLADDPRFARDVAESTGYVPQAILATPITADGKDPLGVLSILDRGASGAAVASDAFALAASFAALAVPWLEAVDVTLRLAPVMLRALASAIGADTDLGLALEEEARRGGSSDDQALVELCALLASARVAGPAAAEAASRVLREVLAFATSRRAR